MGEFHDAVSTLLEAFGRGVLLIKTQRGKRKRASIQVDPTTKNAESTLSKTLKRSKVEVKNAYGQHLARHPGFNQGDSEAHSSLHAILFRLNAAFVSVIARFTSGHSTPDDYQALLTLSNASRIEAINTFSQLSYRLSRSSLAFVPVSPNPQSRASHKRHVKKSSTPSLDARKHTRSSSAPELSVSREGWVRRPKNARKQFSEPSKSSSTTSRSGSSTPKRSAAKPRAPPPIYEEEQAPSRALITAPTSPPPIPLSSKPRYRPEQDDTEQANHQTQAAFSLNRKSFMSFASDSTKLGEIPEHKWARTGMYEDGKLSYPVTTYYPLEPYPEPEKKPKSRLRRLFGR